MKKCTRENYFGEFDDFLKEKKKETQKCVKII